MSNNPQILIVDDEPSICSGCRMILAENGYDVDISLSGMGGLEKVSRNAFDIIILDIRLPDVNGIELLKEINAGDDRPHVIIMTGHGTVENAVEAMKNGAFDFIKKPFSEKELLRSVIKAIDNRKLVQENLQLKKQLFNRFSFDNIIGENPLMKKVFNKIERVAPLDNTVLLEGESGTGKELFANAIHVHSKRVGQRLLAVDCSTFSPSVMESELFGHVKGAFTGADKEMPGIFETASSGTLFLDEITNLDLDIQGKLLRVLESGEYKAVGSSRIKITDARIIAATNMDIKKMVKDRMFREDLFYRLNVFPIRIPPLRERRDDIPKLAYHFLRNFCKKTGKNIPGFSDDALKILVENRWPGNVRQLKNAVERLVIMSDGNQLDGNLIDDDLEAGTLGGSMEFSVPSSLDELKIAKKLFLEKYFSRVEIAFLQKALEGSDGNITRSAQMVGMQRSNFSALMKKHGVRYRKDLPPDKGII